MKKVILFLGFLSLLLNNAYSVDYSTYCSTKSAKTTFGGTLASLTGVNFISKNIVENEIEKSLKKETNSKFKVQIENFYGVNVLNGEFKSMSAKADSVNYEGIYVSDVNVDTICDYNNVVYKNNKIKFVENLPLKYSVKITQDDLNKTVNSTEYKKIINKMNKSETISSLFKIDASKILIKDNKIVLNYSILPLSNLNMSIIKKLVQPIKISIKGDLVVKDEEIELCNLELNSKKVSYLPTTLLSLLNPLNYNIKISKTKQSELHIQNVEIKNNEILISGVALIPKD